MRLKIACWFFAALTVFLLLGWPALVGLPPKGASRQVIKEVAVRAEIHVIALVVCFMTTTVLAALVVRQHRQEYLAESAANLRTLIEGTLEDHKNKRGSEEEPS